ncbi:methyltransferase domain-containing protein [Pusillimonas sp. TS35]|uniref:CheR family methyltransferase n=1 Tax=Paracandidimonas lactea TaxID=2895524 RepID=UPI00136B37AC|nr:CheR family methyltransferase [Paracandidimonas lactea]MYN11624.1 methyltransferase domain-containing protein [Pusillimonas sp. TS35]
MADSFLFAVQSGPEAQPGDFGRAARLLRQRVGIILADHKREMVERKLGMRAKALGMSSISAYLDCLESNADDAEWEGFINGFTINHTAFFREQHHFELLAEHARSRPRPLSVWCCASSTGEEAYSIAMTLQDICGGRQGSFNLLATDIDTQALVTARRGVYSLDRVSSVPQAFLRTYFQRGIRREAGRVRVSSTLREAVQFEHLNLLSRDWPAGPFDAVFCRNTMIYFDKPTQTRLLERFAGVLKPGGLLFVGHSENFTYLTKALRLRGQTVYEVAR